LLSELAEADAQGRAAEIYTDIMNATDVGMVSMCYRHVAAVPAQLEWAWRVLGPEYVSGRQAELASSLSQRAGADAFGAVAAELPDPPELPADAVTSITAVMDAFNRTNPMNYLWVSVLTRLLESEEPLGNQPSEPNRPPAITLPVLPDIVLMEDMTPEIHDTLVELSNLGAGKHDDIIPSLFRHVVYWPDYIGYVHSILTRPGVYDLIEQAAARFREDAAAKVEILMESCAPRDAAAGRPTGEARLEILRTLPMFLPRIPMMVAIGGLLRLKQPD
jgi:hypothetical protein